MPGGGPAEPSDEEALAHPEARWSVSGKAEVNCLACHNRSGRQDHSEWAKQVLRENLRWAATAAGGVGEVGGMASRLKETWDIADGPNLDDHEWAVVPSVNYRTRRLRLQAALFLRPQLPAGGRPLPGLPLGLAHGRGPVERRRRRPRGGRPEVRRLPPERPRPRHRPRLRGRSGRDREPDGGVVHLPRLPSRRERRGREDGRSRPARRPLSQAHRHPARPLQAARLHRVPFGAEAEGRLHPGEDVAGQPPRHLRRRDLVDGHARDRRARL